MRRTEPGLGRYFLGEATSMTILTDLPPPPQEDRTGGNGTRRALVAAGIGSAALAAALLYCRANSRAKSRVKSAQEDVSPEPPASARPAAAGSAAPAG